MRVEPLQPLFPLRPSHAFGLTRLNAWSCCCVTCHSVVLGSSFATASEDAVSELIEQRKEVRVMQQWPAPTAAGLAGSSQVACCV